MGVLEGRTDKIPLSRAIYVEGFRKYVLPVLSLAAVSGVIFEIWRAYLIPSLENGDVRSLSVAESNLEKESILGGFMAETFPCTDQAVSNYFFIGK